jgi:aminopeptidase N
MYAQALQLFKDPALVQKNLETVMSPAVRSQDAMQVLFTLLNNDDTREQTWKFVTTNWDTLKNKLATYDRAEAIFLGTAFCSEQKRDEVQKFFGSQNIPGGERPMKQMLEAVDRCIRIKNQQQPNLDSWLKQQPQLTAGE